MSYVISVDRFYILDGEEGSICKLEQTFTFYFMFIYLFVYEIIYNIIYLINYICIFT